MSTYYQTVYDTGASRWVYYSKTSIDASPLSTETSPNWVGPITQHSVLFVDPSVSTATNQTIQSAELAWTVAGGTSMRQVVYKTGVDDTTGLADNGSISTAPAMGMVSNVSGTTATLVYQGEVTGFAGLTTGAAYYLGTSGNITTTALDPIAEAGTGKVLQKIGYAKSTTVMIFDPNLPTIL